MSKGGNTKTGLGLGGVLGGNVGAGIDLASGRSLGDIASQFTATAVDPNSTNALEQIAVSMFNQTQPIRGGLIDQSTSFVNGGFDPTATPSYEFARSNVAQNTNAARDNILSTLAPGGSLDQGLIDLELNRANALTGASSDIYGQQMNQAFQTAFGAPLSTSTNSLANAANLQSQTAMANAANQNAKIGSTKQGAGMALGLGL